MIFAGLGDNDRGTIAVIDRSRKKTTLTQEWTAESGLAWAAGGREIWFTAAPPFYSLRAVSLSGKSRVILHAPGDFTIHDVSRDGHVLLGGFQHRLGLMGTNPGESEEHEWSLFDYSMLMHITPDGSKVLTTEGGRAGGPLYAVFLRRAGESGAVRLGDGLAEGLSPDGRWVLSLLPTSPPQLTLIPTGAGQPRMLARDSIAYQRAWWFPDGKRILVAGSEPGHRQRVYIRGLDGGKLQPLTPEGIGGWSGEDILSADGKWIAVAEVGQKAKLYPVEGGEPRSIPGITEDDVPIQWAADGQSLYVRRTDDMPAHVSRLHLGTGRRELWKEIAPADRAGVVQIRTILPSRDGRAYAYCYHRILSELYVVDGLK